MPDSQPTIDQLKKALEIAEKIQALEAELASLLGKAGISKKKVKAPVVKVEVEEPVKKEKAPKKAAKKRRELSPEARERIAAAQRARWANAKQA